MVLARHQSAGRAIHERLFFRPLLEAFAGPSGRPTGNERAVAEHSFAQGAAEERLAAFGFADAERTRQALGELTRGLTRSSRLMHSCSRCCSTGCLSRQTLTRASWRCEPSPAPPTGAIFS